MIKSRRRVTVAGASVLAVLLVVIAVLSWNAGGPQPVREIVEPVALPDLPQ